MAAEILKTLVSMANMEVDCIDVNAFFQKIPNTPQVTNTLKQLKNAGYISLLIGEGEILEIGVNQKAIDLF